MRGIDKAYCNAAIKAVLGGYRAFMQTGVGELLQPVTTYGKGDTLGLDAVPEIAIVSHLEEFDDLAIIVTEERGTREKVHFVNASDPKRFSTVFLSDPFDRSNAMQKFLARIKDGQRLAQDVFAEACMRQQWEQTFGSPAGVTGACSAITCIRGGIPVFAVIVNFVTQELFVACGAGTRRFDVKDGSLSPTLNDVLALGQKIYFDGNYGLDRNSMKRFVTFLGKSGYRENFNQSSLHNNECLDKYLHYDQPGGPLRPLYLSRDLYTEQPSVGFILANGEKIGEWIHWLPFVQYAHLEHDQSECALRIYEVHQERPMMKDGVLMATGGAYSVFKPIDPQQDDVVTLDVASFAHFPNPSRIRATLIVSPRDNEWVKGVVTRQGFREVRF
ncbi:MAG: hypothetical protein HYT98_00230 [Candidatus Sungbacteria bacterium]|nr:hypothetical protein [Candidatus Sungbacteria bacterium]